MSLAGQKLGSWRHDRDIVPDAPSLRSPPSSLSLSNSVHGQEGTDTQALPLSGQAMTPQEKLRSLPKVEEHLVPAIALEKLDAMATECSDNEAAQRSSEARTTRFQWTNKTQHRAA